MKRLTTIVIMLSCSTAFAKSDLDEKLAQAGENADASLRLLRDIEAEENAHSAHPYAQFMGLPKDFVAAANAEAALREVAAICQQYSAHHEVPPDSGQMLDAAGSCRRVTSYKQLLAKGLLGLLHAEEAIWAADAQDDNKRLRETKHADPELRKKIDHAEAEAAAERAEFEPAFNALHVSMPASTFAAFLAARKTGKQLLGATIPDEARPILREFQKRGAVYDKLARALAKTIPTAGAKYVGFGIDPAIAIEKNALDIPVRKYLTVRAVVRMPRESFCRGYDFVAYADYAGGGRYSSSWYYTQDEAFSSSDFDKQEYEKGKCP
jgi:hypothetical protein